MKTFERITIYTIIGILVSLNVYQCTRCTPSEGDRATTYDTLVYVDTLRYQLPVPRDSIVVRYITAKLPIEEKGRTAPAIADKATPDSASVQIPITQKRYQTEEYQAWVSGYHPQLDSLHVYPTTTVVTIRQADKPKRWGLGLQVGYGITPTGLQPYLGIGVSYNIIRW